MHLSHGLVLLPVCFVACTVTINQALEQLPITAPEPPVTPADSVVRLALTRVIKGLPAAKGRPIVVSGQWHDLTRHALPESAHAPIILLSPLKLQELADEYGDIDYVQIQSVEISADTAKIGISLTV